MFIGFHMNILIQLAWVGETKDFHFNNINLLVNRGLYTIMFSLAEEKKKSRTIPFLNLAVR